ncbi:3-keto-5-aminohexanoate cleavage protein [Streptomyces sp. PsTaAH-124]|uniref:3-keto-5-aminohexanoate cleavage protein n=1 Tax=Streptomyces sp. PsTaAH-124 TaxID=1157638 RepID=UPI000377278E|nr:3-keto-5-aminohexanoate cleavage protein [Streptomyces sp. PsTaAH-124]
MQVCLNGSRTARDGATVPLTPDQAAGSAAAAVAAGATEVHVHPRTPCGRESLSPRVVAATVEAIRERVTVPVGVTTGAWTEPGPAARLARVRDWTVLPDLASVNWHEPGAEELAAALLDRGVGVEAGLWSGTDGPARFAASPLAPRVLRVLAEVTDPAAASAGASARALLTAVGDAHGRPVLLHGEEAGTWPVLTLAARLGLPTRIGLEDTLHLPDGEPATSNAELVTQALHLVRRQDGGL